MSRADATYDLITVGAGSAAFAAAIRAINLGARVGMVERSTIGGTCVNTGCIPSKNLLAAAESYHRAGHHPFPGISTSQSGVDMSAVVKTKRNVVQMLRKRKYVDLAGLYGVDIIRGSGRFAGPDVIDVGGRRLEAARFLIATGSAPRVPPLKGLKEAGYLTSTTAMRLEEHPESLLVIGGGYIGLELGQLFAHLGTKVTIVEALDRIAPFEEPEISRWMTRILGDQGIEVATSAKVVQVERGASKVLVANAGAEVRRFEGSEVLIAMGRRPVLSGLDLDRAGVQTDEHGNLVLDDELRTTNNRIFAAGDVTGGPQFVYVAAAQGTLAAENAIGGYGRKIDYEALPRVTFTTPNIAAVGLTEVQAKNEGFDCECRTLELERISRAIVSLDTRGAIKIVAERRTGKVLGIHALGIHAI
ncbi:MAG TPA: mercury(II) reductase, partial [Actinomycetota bacterium]|nr:mercury(II) reductase [Actinomycetota bacterium]